jgi:glycosyltransferase involved in cell wall biosynthesis
MFTDPAPASAALPPHRSTTHLVLIPSYNTGRRLLSTVREALQVWQPVWVVVDGSTDGSHEPVLELARREPGLHVIVRPQNGGKGAAVLTGTEAALAAGFTHVLTMDSDGQHPADKIAWFMETSQRAPAALVLGAPIFGPEAPLARLHGRKLSVAFARLEILGDGIDDPLFGFRVYPAAPLAAALHETSAARGFDFDPEVAVRMVWAGVPTVNLRAACRYIPKAEGGVSHFNYLRDNAKMVWLHLRLLTQLFLWRWPAVLRHQRRRRAVAKPLRETRSLTSVGAESQGSVPPFGRSRS